MKNDGNTGRYGTIEKMPAGRYPAPRILPPARHPRLLVAEGETELLREKRKNPVYVPAVREWERLRKLDLQALMTPAAARDGIALAAIEARAYSYLLDGNRQDGLDAVRFIRQYFDVASFEGLADDYRFMGHTMFTAAEVWDWCHDLLTANDRYTIVAAVENRIAPRMEIGMPPCRYGVTASHQAEAQLLRDWLSFSIAVYDEYPDIYEFVAGRFFYQYVPVRNYWYASGSPINGSSYGGYRFTWDLWSAWIFRKLTGDFVYSPDMKKLPAQWLHFRRPDAQGLRDGDDYNEFGGRWNQYAYPWFLAGNLFRDPVYRKQAFLKLGGHGTFAYTELTLTPVQMMLFDDDSIGEADFAKTYPSVVHYKDPCGVTLARTGYDISPESRDVMALMKIGGLWTANHHHMDFGHFQLYYRGILASDSGAYIHYGSPHDMSYNKQTVAHNCITIFRPGERNGKADNCGGQLMGPGEVVDLHSWLSDPRFRMAEVTGHSEDPDCTYLAGDLTAAYGKKAERVFRRMLFLPRKDREIPAVMLVYDDVVSADPNDRKASLLHCQEAPRVDGNRVIVTRTTCPDSLVAEPTRYGGKLIAQMLLPKDAKIEALGGEGREFLIEGKNYPYDYTGKLKPCVETGWGRVEVRPAAPAKEDRFLNVMLVCDADNPVPESRADAQAVLLESGGFTGAAVLDFAVWFPTRETTVRRSFSLTAPEQTAEWIVTGLAGGIWEVLSEDGTPVLRQYVSPESGVLRIRRGGGTLTIEPSRF